MSHKVDSYIPAIKICGLTDLLETQYLILNSVEYAGVVMFVSKSKRDTQPKEAAQLVQALKGKCKCVAVTVSPTLEQLKVIEDIGFDYIQVHGDLSDSVYTATNIPIIRAINVANHAELTLELAQQIVEMPKVQGILLDGSESGSGHTFNWTEITQIDRKNKLLILAGGLDEKNVSQAIEIVRPDIVDVSSGVEYLQTEQKGKDPKRVAAFVKEVRNVQINSKT